MSLIIDPVFPFSCRYLAYSIRLNVGAVYTVPFHNERSSGPEDGMNKSYDEIINVFEKIDIQYEGKYIKDQQSIYRI